MLVNDINSAVASLAAAGITSPQVDAELLAAHAAGVSRSALRTALAMRQDWPALTPDAVSHLTKTNPAARFNDLVTQRQQRIPLQHLTGTAPFRNLELRVGPGVFIPRPETEQVVQAALTALTELVQASPDRRLIAIDLCTGSGAIAAALAVEGPSQTRIIAVERDPIAAAWAKRNLASTEVELIEADATKPLPAALSLTGQVDLVVSNPPYVPPSAIPHEPEVAEHDPAVALYGGGQDGLRIIRRIVRQTGELLRVGGILVMEHGAEQGPAVRAIVRASGGWRDIVTLPDWTGRDRMVRAVRIG